MTTETITRAGDLPVSQAVFFENRWPIAEAVLEDMHGLAYLWTERAPEYPEPDYATAGLFPAFDQLDRERAAEVQAYREFISSLFDEAEARERALRERTWWLSPSVIAPQVAPPLEPLCPDDDETGHCMACGAGSREPHRDDCAFTAGARADATAALRRWGAKDEDLPADDTPGPASAADEPVAAAEAAPPEGAQDN